MNRKPYRARAGARAAARGGASAVAAAMVLACALPPGASASPLAHGRAGEPRWTASAPWRAGPGSFGSFGSLGGPLMAPLGFGSALVGSAPVGTGPSAVAVNPATHTIYVANGFNNDGPNAGGDTVSVIDARRCRAQDVSRCKGPWPVITVGNGTVNDLPSGIAVDARTDTVYVSNFGDDSVSVFNGASCDALVIAGCGQTPATVPLGTGAAPLALFADPANHTVYIPNFGQGTVSTLDSASCNATDLAACPTTPPPTVAVPGSPNSVDVNQATHTVYVTECATANGCPTGTFDGWSVLDANRCNATVQSGCDQQGTLPGDPAGPNQAQVDPANNTLYTATFDNTISAFDVRHCNARDLAGCATARSGTVTPWPNPGFNENNMWVAVDASQHSVYAAYARDDVLVVVDTGLCNASNLSACAKLRPPAIHTDAQPEAIVLDRQTQTLYAADQLDNDVSVINASRCNAREVSGCRHRPPAVTLPQSGGISVDTAAHTTYVTTGSNAVAMIDTNSCNAQDPAGCARTPRSVTVGEMPVAVAIDRRGHTVYVANYGAGSTGTISVLDARRCNATRSAGCAVLVTLEVPGGNPDDLALDPATETLYVATVAASGPDLISVFNVASCSAANPHGCQQTPATLPVGYSGDRFSVLTLAVNHATDTVYATNLVTGGAGAFTGSSLYVINGATCNGQDTTGCGQTPATIAVGFGAEGVALDSSTHKVYVNNIEDSSVSIIDGASCNSQLTTGCGMTPHRVATGDYPGADLAETNQSSNSSQPIAIDPTHSTAYVQDIEGISIIP